MPRIDNTDPPRFREGDTITINGSAFSPTFGQNNVLIEGLNAPPNSESATAIEVVVPAGISSDEYVGVSVSRSDTLESDAISVFSKAPLDDLRDGTVLVPGQIPGSIESVDPTQQPESAQAQDYERMATVAEWTLLEVLGSVGDLFASDGVDMDPEPVGAAGLVLEADPAGTRGLVYGTHARRLTLGWAVRNSSGADDGAMVAGGDSDNNSNALGEHGVPVAGTVDQFTVLVQADAGPGLDQVQLYLNGVLNHDSGAGLALTAGQSYSANPATAVVAGDRLEVRQFRGGGAGTIRLRGKVTIA